MPWHERKGAGAALRLAGLLLLCIAALIARHLFAAPDVHAKERPLPYLLAVIGMIGTSCGAPMALLGRHLFDPVKLPRRWARHVPWQDR